MTTKSQKFLWVLLAVFITSGLVTKTQAQSVKIAFVDLRRALSETNEGKKAMKKLKKEKDKMQTRIERKEKEILKMKKQIEKQQSILSKDAIQKKVETYYQSVQELQATYGQFQQELGKKEGEATRDILIKMEKILADMGKSQGYTMIYDRSSGAVVWAPAHLDLTDKLIQKYNKKYK